MSECWAGPACFRLLRPMQDQEEDDDDDFYERPQPVQNECRCGECCRCLIIEASVADAEREPKIAEKGSPMFTDARLTRTGKQELECYLLNAEDGDHACVFLDRPTNLCSIYETRPDTCRYFDCDGEGREQLIQLGVLPP